MRNQFVPFLLLIVAALSSCNSPGKKEAPDSVKPTDSLSASLGEFVREGHRGCVSIIELAGIASKSENLEVRNFGTQAAAEYKLLLDSIQTIAESLNLPLYDSASIVASELVTRVSANTGIDFERQLIRALSTEHRRISSAFRKGRRSSDEDVKKFVRNNMPILRRQTEALLLIRKNMRSTDQEENEGNQKPA